MIDLFHRSSIALLLSAACVFSCVASGSALAQSQATAQSDLPKDYSHSMMLDAQGKSGVVALRLPLNFYQYAHAANLADMRLFDAEGKKVAFALHQPSIPAVQHSTNLRSKIFPLYGAQSGEADKLDFAVDVQRNSQGVVTSAKIRNNEGGKATNTKLQALLLDFGLADKLEAPLIDSLQIQLPSDKTEYAAQVWLAVSDDLQHWETLAASDIRWLANQQNERLVQDRIQFEARRFRYARLTWASGEALAFANVNARALSVSTSGPQLESIAIPAEKGKFAQDIQYKVAPAIPVEKINLLFTQPNVVLPAQLGTYRLLPKVKAGQAEHWEFMPQMSNVFYQIEQNGQTRRSSEMSIPISHYATWVVRMPEGNPLAQDKLPQLKISWQAASMIFLASGKGPYQLAFGRDNVNSAASEMANVAPNFSIDELAKLEQIKAGVLQINPSFVASGANATEKLGAEARQRSYLLWGILLAGVAVMGGMVWRLVKQMKEGA